MEPTTIDEFCEYLKANGRMSTTVDEYRRNLEQFSKWCNALSIDSFFDVTADDIQAYFAEINEQYPNSATAYKKGKAVHTFYDWLQQEGRILCNPSPLPQERRNDSLPSVVTEQTTIKDILSKLNGSGSLAEKRDRVMIDIAYSCALRRCELHSLDLQNIHGNFLRVTGKKGKQRDVPIGTRALESLLDYVHHVRPKICKTGNTSAVFVSWIGGGKRMHLYSINAVFRRLRKTYKLGNDLRPHALRHAFGRDMIRSGCPVEKVSEILGHSKLETTQIYTRLAPLDLKNAHQKFHPRS